MKTNNFFNNKYSLLIIIIIAFIYNIIVYRSKISPIIMFIVLLYFIYLYDIQNKINNKDFQNENDLIIKYSEDFIDKETDKLKDNEFYIDSLNIYPIYKNPKKFLFLKQDKFLEKVIYDMRFIEKYDKGDYFKLIILIENFLKIYYNLIIDRYDIDYVDILLDTRKEILNLMYNFKVDAPQYNRKGNYIQGKIHSNIIKIQSYTYQKIKNINKKYPRIQVKNPNGISKKDLYDNYKIIV